MNLDINKKISNKQPYIVPQGTRKRKTKSNIRRKKHNKD